MLRRSVHAHIVLWLHDEDVEEVCNKIVSCMPAEWDPEATDPAHPDEKGAWRWLSPSVLHTELFNIVHRKQAHRCTEVCAERRLCWLHDREPCYARNEMTA